MHRTRHIKAKKSLVSQAVTAAFLTVNGSAALAVPANCPDPNISTSQSGCLVGNPTTLNNGVTVTGNINFDAPSSSLTILGGSITGTLGSSTSSGVLNINGSFTNGGAINVNKINVNSGGYLTAAGAINNVGSGEITINSGGTLRRNGLVFYGKVTNHGTLYVPAATTASIGGTYTQGANGIFQVGVASDTSYGKLIVSGGPNATTLPSTPKIDVKVTSGASLTAETVLTDVLKDTSTTLTSTGFTVTDDSDLFDFVASLNGTNSINLTVKAASVGLTKAKRPLMTTGVTDTTFTNMNSGNRVIQAVQDSNKGLSSGDEFVGDSAMWLRPMGSLAKQKDSNNVSGYEANSYGVMLGGDRAISSTTRLGVAVGFSQIDLKSNRTLAEHNAKVDGYRLIGYGSYSLDDRTDISFQADVGMGTVRGERVVAAGTVASSKYDNTNYHIGVGYGKIFKTGDRSTFTPSIRGDYSSATDAGYTETGAGASNLVVSSNTAEEAVISVDGKFNMSVSENTNFTANFGVGYDTIGARAKIKASTIGGTPFVVNGMDPQPLIMRAGLGFIHTTKKGFEVTARYDFEGRTGFENHMATVKLRMPF